MKLGLCTSFENIELAAKAGYDFFEPPVVSLGGKSEQEIVQMRQMLIDSPVQPLCFNILLPGGTMVVGPEADAQKLEEYLETALARVSLLGGETVVWGSGYARRCPEGFEKQRAYDQLVAAGRIIGKAAEKNGITIVIEPLAPKETNMINTVAQGAELARAVNMSSIKLLADAYHMRASKEPFSEIARYGELIRHIHVVDAAVADPDVREFPTAQDKYGTSAMIEVLKGMGYEGTASLECIGRDNYSEQIVRAQQAVRDWMK